jgi:hypothetical protein
VELIGTFERAFAAWIYPNRFLVGMLLGVIVAAVLAVGWRQRWDLAARRHPLTTVGGLALVLAVAGPLGWYLGSPLAVSTSIDEAPPVIAAVASPAASETPRPLSGSPAPSPTAAASAQPSSDPSPQSPAPGLLSERYGTFSGADDFHFGKGTARLIETSAGSFTLRLERFAVRNGPDLHVYLSPSPDGYATGAIELGRLKADRGNQNYRVPAGADVASVRSVVIWCKQFSVLFATAPLR